MYSGAFYMGKFAGPSPKRHRIWTNDKTLVEKIVARAGYMSRLELREFATKLTRRYIDALGVKRYSGVTRKLKASQNLDPKLYIYVRPFAL